MRLQNSGCENAYTSSWIEFHSGIRTRSTLLIPSRCLRYSRKVAERSGAKPALLQNHLIALVQALQHLGFRAIRDADVDGRFTLAVFAFRVGNFDRSVAIFVVDDGALGNLQHALVLIQNDLGVGGHIRFQLAAGIVDRDTHFEGGDIILFYPHGRDFRDHAFEGLVFEGFDFNPRRLAEIHAPDIALVDFALYIDLAGVADGHHQSCARSQHQDGTDRIANFHIAGKNDSGNRRNNVGVAELL